MAIEGLRTVAQPNQIDISDEVGASVEALDMLGLVQDRDRVADSVTAEFRTLGQVGTSGEAFIQLPRDVITLQGLVTVLDGGKYPQGKYSTTFVYNELWTPGTTSGSYEATELDNLILGQRNSTWPAHARLAVHNPASTQEPLLHFLGKPFDNKYAERKEQTQLKAIAEAAKAYEAEHQDFAMTPLNAKAVAMIALTRRIKGESMPIAWGFMRDATLPRRTVGGDSWVGDVGSAGGRLGLRGGDGNARSDVGVGLSVGPKNLNSQAS